MTNPRATPTPQSAHPLAVRYAVDAVEQIFPLRGAAVAIGRGGDNDIVLSDPSVSRRHARCERLGEVWSLTDLGSTNGVFVDGVKSERATLRAGMRIGIGAFELKVEALAAAPVGTIEIAPRLEAGPAPEIPQGTILRPLAEIASLLGLSGKIAEKRSQLDQAYQNNLFGYLTRLAGLLLSAGSVDDVLEQVMAIAFEAFPVERGFVLLLDGAGKPACELARFGERTVRRPRAEAPISRTILETILRERVALITFDAQNDQRLESGASIRMHQIRAAMCAPLWSGDRIVGIIQLDSPYRADAFTERDLELLTALANYAAVAIERLRNAESAELEKRVRARLERYHSPAVIEEVMRQEEGTAADVPLRPAEVTVLFADLVGFTSIAEREAPEKVAALLAAFFDRAIEAVFAHGGTLDKFIGDCVMAFFGAPMAQEDHAERAVEAAIALQRTLAAWNHTRPPGMRELAVRIAINSGAVVVGEIGSRRRVEYTVLGNAVNIAARLEETVAQSGEIVVGEETARRLGGNIPLEPLGDQALKGLQAAVRAFRVERSW